ncbi:MAG: AbrB/MazE/SpoVT family DNA-binding domain-containing protein [Promethearchaeota archaeon]
MSVSKISKKGQIVIPKEIREKLNFKPGDVILFKIQDKSIHLEKIEQSMADILKDNPPLKDNSTNFQRKLREEWS